MIRKAVVTVTQKAHSQLNKIVKENECKAILFYVQGGGCNGFNYRLEPTNNPPDKLDEIVDMDNYKLQICGNSLMHVLGTEIDWKKDIMGEAFYFNNPMAKSKCGCGTSFSTN